MSEVINEKSFILTVKNSQTYQLIAKGFSQTTLWFINFSQSVLLSAALILIAKGNSTISLDTLRLNFGTMFLSSKITSTILKGISLALVMKLTYAVSSTIENSVVLNNLVRLLGKNTSTLNITSQINLAMLVVLLNFLSDYDGETLGTLDPETLGDLDYTVA